MEEFFYRDKEYFNEVNQYEYADTFGKIFKAKCYKENGFWWFKVDGKVSVGDVKCTSVKCKKL